MNKKFSILVAAIFIALLNACATTPMASKELDAEAKEFLPPLEEHSRIYLYRNEILGAAISMVVVLDGTLQGHTAASTYMVWDVPPGEHTLSSHAEDVSTLTLQTESGKTYFVWQEVKMGLMYARSLLQQVDEETGKKGVLECNLAETAQ